LKCFQQKRQLLSENRLCYQRVRQKPLKNFSKVGEYAERFSALSSKREQFSALSEIMRKKSARRRTLRKDSGAVGENAERILAYSHATLNKPNFAIPEL